MHIPAIAHEAPRASEFEGPRVIGGLFNVAQIVSIICSRKSHRTAGDQWRRGGVAESASSKPFLDSRR
jgi:hypothetical protein